MLQRLQRKFQSLKILFIFLKIDFNYNYYLAMNGTICFCQQLLSFELFLILKCCHKGRIFELFHVSVDKQRKQTCGCNLADLSYSSLFNPHINPTPVLFGDYGTGSASPQGSLLRGWQSRLGWPSVTVPSFQYSCP